MACGIVNSTNLTAQSDVEDSCAPCIENFPHTYAAILALNSLFWLPLKVWNVWVMVSPRITKKTDVFTLNMMIFIIIVSITNFLIMSGQVLFHHASQLLWKVLISFVTFGLPLFHCYICVERYIAVQHPIIFLKYRPLRYRVQVLAPAWMALLLVCGASFAHCMARVGNLPQFLVTQCISLLPFFVLNSFCCLSILKALRRPSPGSKSTDIKMHRGEKQKKRKTWDLKMSAFRAVAGIQIYIVISYLPPTCLTFTFSGMSESEFCVAYMTNIAFALITSSLFSLYNLYTVGKLRWSHRLKGK